MIGVSIEKFKSISPADFFYKNREIAGFDNPAKATYMIIRELVENSLDACETHKIIPEIYIRLRKVPTTPNVYEIHVQDNGCGIPFDHIPPAFGQILYSSKYVLRQTRGTFGMGGKMAILYGQITTHFPVTIISSTGVEDWYLFKLMIDIQSNKPIVKSRRSFPNPSHNHGTIIEFRFEGDYTRAKQRIIEYLKLTATILPYLNLTFIDPDGVLYLFSRSTKILPKPPIEVLPHPNGVDTETLSRLISETKAKSMIEFLQKHFHRVGKRTAVKFLKHVNVDPSRSPKSLVSDEILHLGQAMRNYKFFLPPDAKCLSTIGTDLLIKGIKKEFNPEFVVAVTRPPSVYEGHPFIVEAAIAYGGNVSSPQCPGDINLFRFANKIPLLYDAYNDVSMKVIKKIKWWRYRVDIEKDPIAFFIHICSTKIPYKTIGKEYIADRPEIEYEIEWALKNCGKRLRAYLMRKAKMEIKKRRLLILEKYLPHIAKFASELAGKSDIPNYFKLLKHID